VWKFYPGTYLAATVADTNTGTYVDPYEGDCIADWEVFTLSGSGANIDFSTGRTYTDVSIGSGLADPASYTILMAYLSQGELRNATLGVSLSTMLDGEPKPLRVKKDAFSFVQVSETDFTVDEDTGIYTGTGVYYTRTVSGLGSAVNWTIPTLEDSFTASLSFHDAEGKTGRFTPGQDVSGQLHLVHDGWEMTTAFAFAMEMTGEDDGSDENSTYATLRVRAVCEDGTELTTEETDMATVFRFKAPAATTRVTATATLKMEGMIDRSFGPATAPIVVGEGGDMEPPAVPAGFAGTATATEVSFTWTKNTDYDLDGYTIYFVDKNDIATPVGTAGKDAASATFPIDYAAWGVEGWHFAIAAFDDTGNESERCAPVNCMPDAGNLKGTLALSAASGYGTYADGRFTLNGSNEGRAQLAYTPDAGTPAISGGALLLVYRDTQGATQTATVSGSYSGSATWTIPADAACLLAAACTCSEGTILKSLSETPIVAHITVKNNAGASYTLATSFDSGRILMGVRTAATLEKSGSSYVGDLSRDLYRDATLEFFADGERFRAVKKLQALSTGSDAFAVGVNDLPQKVKLVVNGAFEREDLDINAYFPTGNADDPYITATRGSVRKTEDGLVCFFERPVSAASIGTIVFDLDVDANDAAYVLEYTAGGSLTTAGAAFATGSTYTIGAHLKVANLEQFMYLDVRCVGGSEEKEPYQDLWFTLTDDTGKTRNVSWYHKTKQLDTKELTAGKTYRIDYYNYYIHNVFDMGDQTVKIVNGEASYSPMKKVTMGEQAVVRVNLQFYTDENGVPGREGGSKNFQADYDVYYMNATTHAWTPLSGQLNHFSDTSAGASSAGLTSWFESEPIAADLLDTEAGLKLVLADSGYLVARESNIGYINGAGVTHGYVIPGEEVRLVEDQVFYTDMRPENGGISSVNMAATIEDLRANDWENHLSNYYQNYALTWTIGSVDDNGDIHSGMISGFALAQMPRIDLHLTRGAENLLLTFALRNTATGETYRYDRNMIGNGTADSVKQYALDGLPYGTYDVLMTLGSGSDVLQLVSQFMNGADTVVPDTVCGLLEKNVAVTPADAVIDLTLDPWSVDENVPGIQGIAVTPSKDYVLTGERVNYSLRFTCIPGASEEDRTLHFSGYGFALDGISAQLRTADGRAVSLQDQTVNTGDKQGTAVIPASSQKITGTIVVTGIAGGSGSYSTLHAYVGKHYEAGGIYESHTTVRDFEGTIPKTIKAANAVLSGRGSAETEITIEIAAKADPSRKVEDTAWISRYGYWKIEMEYPIEEGQAEDFTVTIRDEHGTVLKEGETAYEVETVLPYRVNVTTYCNGQKNVLTGYPGSEKDFRSLNSAAVVFGTDYEATNIELDLYFDDTNEDAWGLTDARRVHDLILSIELQSLGMDMPIYYVFQPVDEKTYTYHNDLIDLTMENVPYSTHYKVEFPAYHYGRFGIS
ncbi:MAG: hypothetical protein K5981_05680, partial [Clostridia bacterium]|nr:hypothetical protein [Clostridia bacterium]